MLAKMYEFFDISRVCDRANARRRHFHVPLINSVFSCRVNIRQMCRHTEPTPDWGATFLQQTLHETLCLVPPHRSPGLWIIYTSKLRFFACFCLVLVSLATLCRGLLVAIIQAKSKSTGVIVVSSRDIKPETKYLVGLCYPGIICEVFTP